VNGRLLLESAERLHPHNLASLKTPILQWKWSRLRYLVALVWSMKGDFLLASAETRLRESAPSKESEATPTLCCARGTSAPRGRRSAICALAPHLQGVPMVKVVQVADGNRTLSGTASP